MKMALECNRMMTELFCELIKYKTHSVGQKLYQECQEWVEIVALVNTYNSICRIVNFKYCPSSHPKSVPIEYMQKWTSQIEGYSKMNPHPL